MQSSYSIPLVVLSYLVAVLASHVTLSLAQRLRPTEGPPTAYRPTYWPWIFGGAFSMGTGIWSMHFIGMLAFHLPIQVVYDVRWTAASYVIAVVVSGFALHRFHRNDTTVRGIALPGVFIGVGISAMHYTGMAAMRMAPGIYFEPLLVATSVLIAIGAAIAALWIAFSLPQGRWRRSWHKLVAASVMGAAIVGMHYTGMAAANFAPDAVCISSGPRLDTNWLAITISAFTFLILGSTVLLSVVDAQLQSTIARSAEALRIANEALEQRVLDRTAQLQSVNHRLQAEVAARQQAQLVLARFAAIVESSDDAIVGESLDGIITSWNRGAERLYGYCADEIIGQPMLRLIPPELNAEEVEILARIARGEGMEHFETIRTAKGGRRLDVSLTISPVREAEGRIVGAATIARDITERRQALQKLQTQLARQDLLHRITRAIGERQDLPSIFQVIVRSLEESLPLDFCCVCLQEGAALRVASVGVRSRQLAGELALTEKSAIDIDENGMSRCMEGQLLYEPDIETMEYSFPQRLGQAGLHSLVVAPLLVESQVFGVLVAARRTTHGFTSGECEFLKQLSDHAALAAHQAQLHGVLQQAYDDLRQTQQAAMQQERLRALGQMASGIAHDINNALSPVMLYTDALLEKEPGVSERGREYLATIRRGIEDVAETVARMREFYRPRQSQGALARVDLNRLVEQVIGLTRARWSDQAQLRGAVIELNTELAAGLPPVSGVEGEIRDALTNLIFNAVDAMTEGGTLTLRTKVLTADAVVGSRTSSRLCVEISDTGIGMDEETRRHCLEPFFTTKGERGTGLGLAMVYGMAQRHGGELEIESRRGRGTTVRLVFPTATVATSAVARPPTPQQLQRLLRILLVDDDPLVAESLRNALHGDGHLVTTADGGRAGIDTFMSAQNRGEPFDIVITDLGMPHVDGRKVAAAIRAASPGTPIILLTGWGQRLASESGVPPEVSRLLSKPPKLRDLRVTLAELTQTELSRNVS
jgi:PAS domain S-box-containing protein